MELLKTKRRELGITQDQLAAHFNYSRQNVSNKERQKQPWKLSEIKELKQILSLTNDEIYEIFID